MTNASTPPAIATYRNAVTIRPLPSRVPAAANNFTPVYPSPANCGGGYPYFAVNGVASSSMACFCAPAGSAADLVG